MPVIAGIDGCPKGWLCLTQDLSTGQVHATILCRIDELLTLTPQPDLVAIDIPIGLPDSGPRQCDTEARSFLKFPRSCSVFPAPIRPVLVATTYPQACRLRQKAENKKLSRQSYAILKKISEVDAFLQADPIRQRWLREVHPELSFWAWNKKRPMAHRKKSVAGKAEREALVNQVFPAAYRTARSNVTRGDYANDDLLDAFAALWTARRIFSGCAMILPANPAIDSTGLKMEMLA